MMAGQRSARNHIIVEVLRDYGYVDARGMGIRTKVIPLMQARNGVDPIFEATEDFLKTVLGARKARHGQRSASIKGDSPSNGALKVHGRGGDASISAPINDIHTQLLELIRSEPAISYDRLAEKLGINRTTVMRNVKKLKNTGLLQRYGARKRGHWEVIG
jgi:ATP-dependent DNA helicase RecG